MRVGTRARIDQPRLPEVTWTITALEPGRSFEWESRATGVKSIASHLVEPSADGGSSSMSDGSPDTISLGRPVDPPEVGAFHAGDTASGSGPSLRSAGAS